MAIVEITSAFEKEINKTFRSKSVEISEFLKTLENTPKKGKHLGNVGAIAIRELKRGNYRFYYITDAHRIRFCKVEDLTDLLLKFVRLSNKKSQQKVIGEIKQVLLEMGSNESRYEEYEKKKLSFSEKEAIKHINKDI